VALPSGDQQSSERVTVAKPGSSAVTRWTPVRTGQPERAALIGDGHEVLPVASCVAVMVTAGQHAARRVGDGAGQRRVLREGRGR